jgi:hypothetical protein
MKHKTLFQPPMKRNYQNQSNLIKIMAPNRLPMGSLSGVGASTLDTGHILKTSMWVLFACHPS